MIRFLASVLLGSLIATTGWSDKMNNYEHIAQSIPKMEMKADAQSQAWARSARNVLIITNESIAETLSAMNELAKKQGTPFFCLPKSKTLDAAMLGEVIRQASKKTQASEQTVSQLALESIMAEYPCQTKQSKASSSLSQMHTAMQHIERG